MRASSHFPSNVNQIMSTMRIVALLATFLVVSTAGATEKLYKWTEADGTLTFSRTPPAEGSGINYEVVGANSGTNQLKQAQPVKQPSTDTMINQGSAISQSSAPTVSSAKKIAPSPSMRKSTQCGELQKRVLSLERLLRTDISAETMDNAVVQMARYQNSFNQACNRNKN